MKIISNAPESVKITKFDASTEVVHNVVSIEYNFAPGQIVPYSQRDPRWKDDLMMGNSTIGGWGCAMICCAMLLSQIDDNITPKTLNQWLKANNGYTADNRIIWGKVNEFNPHLKFNCYYLWRDLPADIPLLLQKLQSGAKIIQVDFTPGGALNTHFVLVTKSIDNDLEIIDPWDGVYTRLLQRYALSDWSLARAVYAMADYEII